MTRTRPTAQDAKDAADWRFFTENTDMFHHLGGSTWEIYARDIDRTEASITTLGLPDAITIARRLKEQADG